jgi:DNA (cytosine-5)-methyltransferase 1
MRLLDAYCKAGGASKGYANAGFEVVGVDIESQPNYPYEFHQGDAIEFIAEYGHEFDAIHASPPCPSYSSLAVMPNAREHPRLVEPTREALKAAGRPYVIENVVGAPLIAPVKLCGAAFGLSYGEFVLARHRLFECSFFVMSVGCAHRDRKVVGFYGDHARTNRRARSMNDGQLNAVDSLAAGREAMGIDWMTWKELAQAIPPAYTEHISYYLMRHLESNRPPLRRTRA